MTDYGGSGKFKTGTRRKCLLSVLFGLMVLLCLMPVSASAASAKISRKSIEILKGQSYTLQIKNTKKKVKWSSSKKKVATVDSNGVVKGKIAGSTVVTAVVGKKKFTCTVTVRRPVVRVKLSEKSLTLKVGKKAALEAVVKPENAYKKTLVWSSSNDSIASVSAKGKVTANAPGNAVITARATDGSGVTAVCVVMVEEPVKPLTLSRTSMELYEGDFQVLSAYDATDRVVWGSSNRNVAAVGVDGTVVAVGPGTAQIIAMTVNGLQQAHCMVTVQATPTSPSGKALEFLDILEKYSQDVRAGYAQGRYLAYSNSSKLNPATWPATLEAMNTRNISYTNCALMVRVALREMGRLGENQNFWGDLNGIHFNAGVEATLSQSCRIFEVHESPNQLLAEGKLLPGDICTWDGMGHTNVYAGNGLWYDTGRGGDGLYMTHDQLIAGGVKKKILKEDVANDNNNPKLDGDIFVFRSMGPCASINMNTQKVAWIIRIVK